MGALSANVENPTEACRPFDTNRDGFVLGEGGAYFVLERLSHARARGAKIYAEILGGKELSEAFHVTGLDDSSEMLEHLIRMTLERTGLVPSDIGYISAHGTGTMQNDHFEMIGIRNAFGRDVDNVSVSASKSMVGHMINAAGSSELAITTLALRDGFLPPTINLTDPDPDCTFDCVPQVGRRKEVTHALKLSVAFGGHLVGVAMRRWDGPEASESILS